ncbi:hypothetical protein B566_EDAN015348 [Ephemera danica]|nr:hypothetical protein B566_EDAN015348 [Ephemera danica]
MCARTFAERLASSEDVAQPPLVTTNKPPIKRRFIRRMSSEEHVVPEALTKQDTIAVMTAYTKNISDLVYALVDQLQHTHTYTVLTRTTQPAHAVLFLGALAAAWCLQKHPGLAPSPGAALLHLACFAAHFGAQLWMTFVSGLSLYFSLPRHQFGAVQRVLFPRYFALNAALSLGALLGFSRQSPGSTWDNAHILQAAILTASFLGELAVRLYLTGPLVGLIAAKEAIERKAGVGCEVGRQEMGSLVHCPHYARLHAAFRRIHSGIAIANMSCLAASALHLHYLAHHITLV